MNDPICPVHKTKMYLLKGCHTESGGFADNYWYCGERDCHCTEKARNRAEAEMQTPYQDRIDREAEEFLKKEAEAKRQK